MLRRIKIPSALMAGLVLAIVLDTIVQISWKLAVLGIPENTSMPDTAIKAFSGIFLYIALLAFAAQYFNWMQVLSRADLSFAQPITALSYITILIISARTLNEKISATKVMGLALILLGVYFISRTSFKTIRHSIPHDS